MSFRSRIFLILSLLAVLGIIPLTWWMIRGLRAESEDRIRRYEADALQARKNQLHSITELVASLSTNYAQRAQAGEFSLEEAKLRFLTTTAAFRYDDGKGYFWIHQYRGERPGDTPLVVMHPITPDVVGKSIDQFVDFRKLSRIVRNGVAYSIDDPRLASFGIRASAFLIDMNRAVEDDGEGFTTYYWLKPLGDGTTTTEGYRKLSFVKLIPEWNWVVGSGVYLDDIEDGVLAQRVVVRTEETRLIAANVIFTLIVLVINLALAALLSRYLTRPVVSLSEYARAIADGRYPLQIPISESGEFGDVQEAFRHMSLAIREREDELRAKATELENANRDLQVMNRAKSMILANVSHELKTPLVSIRGYIELLLNDAFGPVSGPQREKLMTCTRNADALIALINELLSVSEAASRIKGPTQVVDLREIARHAVETIRPKALEKSVRIELHEADLAAPVKVERDRMGRVLLNLLSNALKFSSAGKQISVTAARSADGKRGIVEVADQGVGIAAEEQKRVFEEFYQVDGGYGRRHGGLGLGLAIVKVIVEESGGTVDLRSEPGEGTTLIVSLPLEESGA